MQNAVAAILRIRRSDARLTPVLTLRHLSILTGAPFGFLRNTVGRKAHVKYKFVLLKKHVPGRSAKRLISIPPKSLMHVQRWIAQNILKFTTPHEASYAFHPQSRPLHAAEQHCGCEWLLKIDLEDFFHSVTEGQVSKVFYKLGYSRLLSFELARITTIVLDQGKIVPNATVRWTKIPHYQHPYEGVLPQGAPTSPMLSNLVFYDTDEKLASLAKKHGFRYTRYADDLAFSCGADRELADMKRFKRLVMTELNAAGFKPNKRKTVIRGPGARRIVLGMLVNGASPRLSREFKNNLRLHLHYLTSPSYGPSAHAESRGTSVSSLYHHVRGLISWAGTVEPRYGAEVLERFHSARWPTVQPRSIEIEAWD